MDSKYRNTGPNTYEVDAGQAWLGTVKRFGSLRSMRHWRAKAPDGGWGPPRQTRDKARDDLIGES